MSVIANSHVRYTFFVNLILGGLGLLYITSLVLNFEDTIGLVIVSFFGGKYYIDGLSLSLLFLNSVVYILSVLYAANSVRFGSKLHLTLLGIVHLVLFIIFLTNNFLLFYIFFEFLLIPMYILISVWGSRGRKIHAAHLFFFFTLASSVPLILAILLLYVKGGSLCFLDFQFFKIERGDLIIILSLFFLGFMSKIPIYPFHIWLPEAHVEAPTTGSVVLAAILLKLGFYGLYRVFVPLCDPEIYLYLRPVIITVLLLSVLYSGLVALRQIDLKKIIAYSSIVHMNFGLLGLFSNSSLGVVGSLFIMVCHGLISAGMFFSVGMLYDRFHVRNIMYYGGLAQYMPLFSILFFLLMFSNMSFPGTCNFVGEYLVYLSIFSSYGLMVLMVSLLGVILTTLFCVMVVGKVLYYQITAFLTNRLYDLDFIEFLILLVLIIYIILFGIYPNSLLEFFIVR